MCWIELGVAGIISLLFLFLIWKRKKKKVRVIQISQGTDRIYEKQEKEKKKICIHIMATLNEKQQINIRCTDMEERELGQLFAVFYTDGTETGEYHNSNTLHLEQLYVAGRYRRKGIGRMMFQYLIREMIMLEKNKGMEFRYIYGEVGEGGRDNPRLSLPFYEKMAELPYGKNATLCYEHTKKKPPEEYDRFTYYINRQIFS